MKRQANSLFLTLGITLLAACQGRQGAIPSDADTVHLRHAHYLTLIEHCDYTEAQIHSPWSEGKRLQTLKAHSTPSPNELGRASRALSFTTTHANLIEELGAMDAIAGICETEYVANKRLRRALAEGNICDIGSAMIPNRERIISLNPDMILLSPYENASTYGNLESLGIPIIQCADYMETSALGRAEWMRLYGRLVGKAHVADSLFAAIEAEYDSLLTLTDSLEWECRPTVLFDTMIGSAWYVPGGRSTMAQLVSDAGGRYLFADNVKSGSVPLAFETVLDCGGQADYWLIRYNNSRQRMTLTDLGNIYQPYTLFKAYSKGEVYGCNSAELIFYEQTPFHPERLLLDYIKILHPALFSADSLRYFHRL
jgi:iron complex transport system substrate-binding protein